MNYITAIRNLDLDTKQQIKSTRESLQDLYLQFHKLLNPKYATFQHKIVCGYFVSEYVIKLGEISSGDDIDTVMLHFCPFTLNGDADFNIDIHKVVFVKRISVYLKKIQQELEQIYQSLP